MVRPANVVSLDGKKLGNIYENMVVDSASKEAFQQGGSVRRLSVRAYDENGNLRPGRTVLDLAGNRLDNGFFGALEAKLSKNAPLTTRQAELFPYLEKYGGVVVGKNGLSIDLPAGTPLSKFTPNRINGPSLPQANDWWKPQ